MVVQFSLRRDQMWRGIRYPAGERLIPEDLARALGWHPPPAKPDPAPEPTPEPEIVEEELVTEEVLPPEPIWPLPAEGTHWAKVRDFVESVIEAKPEGWEQILLKTAERFESYDSIQKLTEEALA